MKILLALGLGRQLARFGIDARSIRLLTPIAQQRSSPLI